MDGVDRRNAIKVAAAAGVVALAGRAEAQDDKQPSGENEGPVIFSPDVATAPGSSEVEVELATRFTKAKGADIQATAAAVCREFNLGEAKWIEIRIGWPPRRSCKAKVFVVLCHPKIQDIQKDVEGCLKVATVVTAIATLVGLISGAGGAVSAIAVASFKIALVVCLQSKGVAWASDIAVRVETRDKSCGPWRT